MTAPHCVSILLSVAALLLAARSASAGTIVVAKNGPITTIQAGVDAAGPGDTIVVKSGIYRENVVIENRDDLTLRASGKVVVDARPQGGAGNGAGIRVADSDGVDLDGFEIRNAADGPGGNPAGHGIECTGNQLTVVDCVALSCTGAGIHVTGDGARVADCLVANSCEGIVVFGGDAKLLDCEVRVCEQVGIVVVGQQAVLRRSKVHGIKFGAGIYVDSASGEVEKCAIENTESNGIIVSGDAARIVRNELELTGYGISVIGASVVIDRNEVRRTFGAGIESSGENPTITGNDVDEVAVNHRGISVSGAAAGGLIEGNDVSHASYVGIQVSDDCSALIVRDNRVRFSGYGHDPGFLVSGDQHVLEDNQALKNGGDGFNIRGSDVVLRGNLASGNGGDGFDVDDAAADSVTLEDNVAKGNAAEGIENNGTGTILTDNESEKNRIDIANDGTVATFGGNDFATGGTATPPEID